MIEGKKKLVLYDFCGTLVDMQTANAYVRYVLRKTNNQDNKIEKIRLFLNKIGFIKHFNHVTRKMAVNKSLLLYQLKGMNYDMLDSFAKEFYENEIKPRFIKQVLGSIEEYKKNGDTVAIVSAGYEIYLKYFAEEYNIPILLSTTFDFSGEVFSGKIIGNDNFGREKLEYISRYFGRSELKRDFLKIIGYTDSKTDMPVLSICDEKICVNRDIEIPKWMRDIKAEVICYVPLE